MSYRETLSLPTWRGIVAVIVLAAVVTAAAVAGIERGVEETVLHDRSRIEAEVLEDEAPQPAASPASAEVAWDLPNLDHDRVDYWVGRFTTDMRDRYAQWLARTGRYGPMISQKLAERDMPQDLIYLAMIESGMSPTAYSHAHASGLWQFISETGRRYGLTVSGVVDERNDPIRSTDAALDYLSYLHDRFDSWYLAAAGYNTGENRVGRIMRQMTGSERGVEEDFYRIWDRLPRETRDYVPLMIAAARVAKEPEKYGFGDVELLPPLAFDEVEITGAVAFATIAGAAGVGESDLRELNPHFKSGLTPRTSAVVRIPEGTAPTFAANFEQALADARPTYARYRVRRGDNLIRIARAHGTTVSALRAENGIRGDRIIAGQTLRVPGR